MHEELHYADPLPLASLDRLNEPKHISFFCAGQPVTQGSKRAFVVKGRPILTEQGGDKLRLWRHALSNEARLAMRDRSPFDGPLSLHATFWLPKPASAPKRKQVWPIKMRSGDWDKLARAFDAFTGVIWQDDAQVVLAQIRKRWADENEPEGPGVSVTIREYR